ncbi:MAG: heterodisulfide reductase-related iron-sulfur binding cluster [Rhodospirillales bacterium]|jgi:glycerol-3-phosphate dehydrogenase subunit C|nr:heterodisulfide reductase-related iron-sulfur binding cluster [Rhodospirillales bacterium]
MREGSLQAPVRHPIGWRDPDFHDEAKLDAEIRRVFDICHGCRRCFNLCDSFPRLFDLVDAADSGEVEGVRSEAFRSVVEACTLCDLCFMTKCPYVPPHEFDLDFPHLMLRYRAVEFRKTGVPFSKRQLTETDRNGTWAAPLAPIANWAGRCGNTLTRPLLEKVADVHRDAYLPSFTGKTFTARAKSSAPEINRNGPAFGRKAVLYATCFANYNNPDIGVATRAVLAKNGVETEVVYPECCGMPQLEYGDIARVSDKAQRVAVELGPWIEKGYDIVALVPSCALMMKFEWPLIEPGSAPVVKLSKAVFDVAEYVVDIAKTHGLADGLSPIAGGIAVHIACHARAQNMGQKAAELLRLLPDTPVTVIERCSGHGGSWGVMKENFEIALKVGRPVAREANEAKARYVLSECPLARDHIVQGMERISGAAPAVEPLHHPIQVLARAYGL